jgi:long-chain acyl-CoA synthetase
LKSVPGRNGENDKTQDRNLAQMFLDRAGVYGGSTRYLSKRAGRYVATSWEESRRAVEEIASGLLDLGLQPEARVAILSATRPEWVEADFAALAAACITVPIYPSSLSSECGYILVDSDTRLVFCENAEQARKIHDAMTSGVDVDGVRRAVEVDHVVVFDGTAEGCITLGEVRDRGRRTWERHAPELAARLRSVGRDDLATIVYTSGTTGVPKGVLQTHGNHLSSVEAIRRVGIVEAGEIDFSFLPLAHSFGRLMEYMGVYLGTTTAFAERIETITDDLAATRPHFLPSVPRIYEKIYAGVQQARAASSPLRRKIFDLAIAIGARRAAYVNEGRSVPSLLAGLDGIAHRLVFSKIHERVGGRMRFLISGGAPLAVEINEFFHAVGLPVLEGYGLTETTPILTCNRPGRTRIGTVGPPIDGVDLRLAGDGEILAKGPNVARGYHRKPEATAEAWDSEGWFHTGDIGEIDAEFLRITDRKKELIKTAGGKYVAPQKIENLLKARPLISQAVVIGDRLKYCVALLTLDEAAVRSWREARSDVTAGGEDEALRAAVEAEVGTVNAQLASFETIKKFAILPADFSIETGELTPSLKIKRKVIADKYADWIASLSRD